MKKAINDTRINDIKTWIPGDFILLTRDYFRAIGLIIAVDLLSKTILVLWEPKCNLKLAQYKVGLLNSQVISKVIIEDAKCQQS